MATTIYFYATTKVGAEKASSYPLYGSTGSSGFVLASFVAERILPHTIIGGVLGMIAVYVINKKKPADADLMETMSEIENG